MLELPSLLQRNSPEFYLQNTRSPRVGALFRFTEKLSQVLFINKFLQRCSSEIYLQIATLTKISQILKELTLCDRKHRQRHTKPHQCQVVGCSRTEGFSTSNDLERHIRSVHPQEQTGGNRYRCSLQACKHKEKIWPRADNFRAHIKRVHQQNIAEEDLERFVVRLVAHNDVVKMAHH